MSKPVDIIRSGLIINFVLLFILIVVIYLAYITEKEYESLKYPKINNIWSYPDVVCQQSAGGGNSSVTFKIPTNTDLLSNQDIKFQSYDSNKGISTQIFNIYLSEALPTDVNTYQGLSVGYLNYSQTGTSIYLQHYYNNRSTSWSVPSIANIFELAYEGTSSNILNQATLKNNSDNILTFSLTSADTGLSIFVEKNGTLLTQGASSLIGAESLNINPPLGVGDGSDNEPIHVMTNYRFANKVANYARTDAGVCHRRCIDPSYASKNLCRDFTFDDTNKLYFYNSNDYRGPNVCKKGQNPSSEPCGIPFCYNSGKPDGGNYQNNTFNIDNTVGPITPSNNSSSYQYKGQPIFEPGGIYANESGNFNSAVQAQDLLFCGGTEIGNNNSSDNPLSAAGNKFPKDSYNNKGAPEVANQPNATVQGNKVILGFK